MKATGPRLCRTFILSDCNYNYHYFKNAITNYNYNITDVQAKDEDIAAKGELITTKDGEIAAIEAHMQVYRYICRNFV